MRALHARGLALAALACLGCPGLGGSAAPPPVVPPPPVLDEGAPAPDVAAIGPHEKPVRLSDFRGKAVVLFFYPVDFGSGGTAEAEEFRDSHAHFKAAGVTVLGVSTDPASSHRDFAERYRLPFPLLADADGTLARAFGVPVEGGVTRHYTFFIDRHGVIRRVWKNVRAWGHAAEVLAWLKSSRR